MIEQKFMPIDELPPVAELIANRGDRKNLISPEGGVFCILDITTNKGYAFKEGDTLPDCFKECFKK